MGKYLAEVGAVKFVKTVSLSTLHWITQWGGISALLTWHNIHPIPLSGFSYAVLNFLLLQLIV